MSVEPFPPAAPVPDRDPDGAPPDAPAWTLRAGQLADLEALARGAFAPLTAFLGQADAVRVACERRLVDGTPWPVPIVLAVPDAVAAASRAARLLRLREPEGRTVATLHVEERFAWEEGQAVAGRLDVVGLPTRPDFAALRREPRPGRIPDDGGLAVMVDGPPGPVRVAHVAERAAGRPVTWLVDAGEAAIDDPAHYRRVRAVVQAVDRRPGWCVAVTPMRRVDDPNDRVLLSAVVARASGCRAIVPPGPIDAPTRELLRDLGVVPHPAGPPEAETPRADGMGLTVLMTGFSGSGKSSIASWLVAKLQERGDRVVTLLDGDVVRTHLSSELGFSRAHRDLNVTRIGYVASQVTKHGGVAVAAPIAPYAASRAEVRRMVEAHGAFVLVHVATPLEVCEQRDPKGLYQRARAGELPAFTGVSDPYEAPVDAEVVLHTVDRTPADCADEIIANLAATGLW